MREAERVATGRTRVGEAAGEGKENIVGNRA